ncbi:MAG: transporter substrate-binding domain-containing protein [Clostridiales bacterium]|jgi:polar amino acid transport system substrate-binding protein|nr:transporter substrate-binding domain-containing protein [Clostridiales bacterium]
MKRLIGISLVLVMLFVSACSGSANSSGTELATLTDGKLTIATGEPAWEPWVINDAPETGEGFEAALAYAVAEKLGYSKEDVVWVRTTFEEAIQPGPKNFDFNLQQYSVTEERKAVVDFSSVYYREPLAVIVKKDDVYASAASIAELKEALFGAASGDIAGEYTRTAVAPNQEVQVFNDLSATALALNAGQIDAMVAGVTTADYIISSEQVENGVIVGTLSGSETATDGLALVLDKDSPLTAAVSKAIDDLEAEGKIAEIAKQYLGQYDAPELK